MHEVVWSDQLLKSVEYAIHDAIAANTHKGECFFRACSYAIQQQVAKHTSVLPMVSSLEEASLLP